MSCGTCSETPVGAKRGAAEATGGPTATGAIYVVTMYRQGEREKHSCVLGAYLDQGAAIQDARVEVEWRGGKYQPEVLACSPNTQERQVVLPLEQP